MLKRALAAAGAAVLVAGLAAPASAAEKESFELNCDNGFSGTVTGTGNGRWTPAIASDGTVFVPIAFGAYSAAAYAPGTIGIEDPIVEFSDDGYVAKKAQQNGRDITECTFSSTVYNVYDEELDMVIDVTFSGEVTATVKR